MPQPAGKAGVNPPLRALPPSPPTWSLWKAYPDTSPGVPEPPMHRQGASERREGLGPGRVCFPRAASPARPAGRLAAWTALTAPRTASSATSRPWLTLPHSLLHSLSLWLPDPGEPSQESSRFVNPIDMRDEGEGESEDSAA
jgi:hypothetical protein